MFQKVSHIILSVLLLVSTIGMIVSIHYCGTTMISVSIFDEADSCCGDSDCCHNENQLFKVNDDFSVTQIVAPPQLSEVDILGHEILNELITIYCESRNNIQPYNDLPPPPKIQKILSLKQVYLL